MQELHARLDALVLQAYGWPVTTSKSELLSRLFDLNQARRLEEEDGEVRWLRPDYQAGRFAGPNIGLEPKRLSQAGFAPAKTAGLTPFPKDPDEQSEAVLKVLEERDNAMSVTETAACFTSRRRSLMRDVEDALLVLAQYGQIGVTSGGRFLARRAA